MLSLGQIEVVGLPAAIEAADVALKAANVELIGYEATDGMGMVAVKVVGQIGAVKAAMAAAEAAAGKISKVFSVSIIARPNDQIEPIVYSPLTVGRPGPTPVKAPVAPTPAPQPPVEAEATPIEPAEATPAEVAEATPVEATPAEATPAEPAVATPDGAETTPSDPAAPQDTPKKRTRPARAKATTVRSKQ